MRLPTSAAGSLGLLTFLSITSQRNFVSASPHGRNIAFAELPGGIFLEKRCSNPCGWSGQLCCSASQACFTDSAGQAQCGSGGGGGNGGNGQAPQTAQGGAGSGGNWQYYTTTYVETDLVTHTSTYSSMAGGGGGGASPTAQGNACSWGGTPCGSTCCANHEVCQSAGTCVAAAGGGSSSYSSYWRPTSSSASYSVPLRPTSGAATNTAAGSATTTQAFQTPVGSAGGINYGPNAMQQTNNGGLSGGAIAGIVIGVIAGIILLLLICFFCCLRAGFEGVMSLLGLRSRRRDREETIIRESHHHHSGSGSRYNGRSGGVGGEVGGGSRHWFGDKPARVERPQKKSGFGNMGAITAGLGGLALALGLKRSHDKRHVEKHSSGTSSSDDSSGYYDTSSSSASSAPPTRSGR